MLSHLVPFLQISQMKWRLKGPSDPEALHFRIPLPTGNITESFGLYALFAGHLEQEVGPVKQAAMRGRPLV